jgi:hypothetical protein
MKKAILTISVVIIAIMLMSTTVYAKRNSHHNWWGKPFASIWKAIDKLSHQVSYNKGKIHQLRHQVKKNTKID